MRARAGFPVGIVVCGCSRLSGRLAVVELGAHTASFAGNSAPAAGNCTPDTPAHHASKSIHCVCCCCLTPPPEPQIYERPPEPARAPHLLTSPHALASPSRSLNFHRRPHHRPPPSPTARSRAVPPWPPAPSPHHTAPSSPSLLVRAPPRVVAMSQRERSAPDVRVQAAG